MDRAGRPANTAGHLRDKMKEMLPQATGALRQVAMIDHTGIGIASVARSAAFYDTALGALGLRRVMQISRE
jgi:hypothetical protein